MSGNSNVCVTSPILHSSRSMSPSSPPTFFHHPSSSRRIVAMRPLATGSSGSSNVINSPNVISGTSSVINGRLTASTSPLALFTAAARSVMTANSVVRCVRPRNIHHDCRTEAATGQSSAVTRKTSADNSRADKVRSEVVLGSDPIIGSLVANSKTVSRNSAPVQSSFIQCSGHEDAFDCSSMSGGTILKKVTSNEDNEVIAYEQLMADPYMVQFVPKFFRTVSRSSSSESNHSSGETFIELEDLLYKFATSLQTSNSSKTTDSNSSKTTDSNSSKTTDSNSSNATDFIPWEQVMGPFVMDIKMGTRTFLESEVTNCKLRSDLFEKNDEN